VICPGCARDNPPAARFCGGCGAPLEARCPACQSPNPPDNRFCHKCGASLDRAATASAPSPPFASPRAYTPKHLAEKILTSASALQGERKQVTVLFVDVSGFTSLSERHDPEDVHALMRRAFDLMLAEVHANEGTVNQFLGDGIMALFGAPIAHEDHARRAVRAALGIARALDAYQAELKPRGITFRARQGLNTGLVVVGSIGGDLRMDYTAVGDTTNVAARLQQTGEPGRVTISEATHRLVHGYFETARIGEVHLKGKAEPMTAWEVLRARESRTRLEVESEHGLTPFVGRERELGMLLDAFERARAGQGQAVLLVGEAGIGKSRLLLELRRRVGEQAVWQEGHCLSFGGAMAFHPLIDLVRRRFGIDEADDEAGIGAKVEQGVAEAGEDPAPIAPYLRALLSVDPGNTAVRTMSPEQRRGETFEAVRRLLVRAAERRPQVLVIEDLHWIDSASEHFLAMLVDSIPALRVLLIFTYRPGYANPFGERSYFTRVVPAALSAEDSARMATAVLAADDLPEGLRSMIGSKAEGNPFYVEELVKSLEESGVLRRDGGGLALTRPLTAVAVPGSIHDVIAARIDRLAEAPKRTLQIAAVIGREFTRRLVDRLAEIRERGDERLRELAALELILERRVYPELVYMFKHALTQDVAYDSLLVQRRRELHALVGLAIEELYADRLPEHYEMLAHHFSKAEDWPRALDYLLKAAEKATRAFGLRQALAHYSEALVATGRLGDRVPVATLARIHRARADLFFGLGEFDRSRVEGETLVDLARRGHDGPAEAGALVQIANALQWSEDFPGAYERAREAIELAERVDAGGPLAGGLFVRGYLSALTGRLDVAEEDLARALEIGERLGDAGRQSLAHHARSLVRSWQGQYREGLAMGTEGVRIAREHQLVIPLLRGFWNQGLAWHEMGEHEQALTVLLEALTLAEKVGDDALIPRFRNTLGFLRIDCGDFEAGVALSEQAYEETRRSSRAGHGTGAERCAFIRNNEADAFMTRGDFGAAAEALEESHHTVKHPPPSRWMTWRYGVHCYASLGQLALLRGDADTARRFAEQCLEDAVPTHARKYESWAWRIKGESAMARRAWPEAEDALQRALATAQAIAHPRQTWLGHLGLGRLHDACGRKDEARAAHGAAWHIIKGLRERVKDPGLRQGFESAPLVREISERLRR
jgi:class 3 adenylate cyclase/tetratricopeptide (TPR) repeat protein